MEMLTFTEPFSITKLPYKDGVLRFWSWIYCIFMAYADGLSCYMPVSHSTGNSLVVQGQTRDAGVVVTASGSGADLLVSAAFAWSFLHLPFSWSVQ